MIRVRFAPSPTGFLHLGNVRTALFNFLFAKKEKGTFILRIEDTDLERSRPEFRDGLMEDLRWMGLDWDEGPEVGGPFAPYEQSQRSAIYQKYIQKLIDEGKAYYCYVTPEEVEEAKKEAVALHQPLRFDNHGRNFSQEEIERRKARGIRPTVRFKIENPELKIQDLIRGEVAFNLDDMVGDFIIQRADGTPTFHMTVCVDDALMGITHVIRGEDHLPNTPKHILLLEGMGFKPPAYGHLSLVHGPGGEPLSKRLAAVSVREFRKKGYLPHGLANYIALLGWAPGNDREIFPWEELQQAFSLDHVGKSSSNFDPDKLNWLNGQHLRMLSDEEFTEQAFAYLQRERKHPGEESLVRRILPVFKESIEYFDQLEERLDFLEGYFEYDNQVLISRPESREIFETALAVLPELTGQGEGLYQEFIDRIKPRVKAKGKDLFMPLRVALTGKEHGPELKRFFSQLGMPFLKKCFERALGRGALYERN